MGDRFNVLIAAALLAAGPLALVAQVNLQPTPPPTITAEERPWFLSRAPVVFAGNLYYPAGPQVYFNRFEMIRSGYYDGVPIYTRTTLEPYSMLFVPVAGGLMQPYERPRAGELAGTAGSTTPSFPIARPSGTVEASASESYSIPQAPGPPTGIGPSMASVIPQPSPTIGTVQPSQPSEGGVATTGAPRPPGVMRSAARPEGLNGVYVDYRGRRWFNRGPAVSLDAGLIAAGTYRGLTVYVKPADITTIYIPVAQSADTLLTPYLLPPSTPSSNRR